MIPMARRRTSRRRTSSSKQPPKPLPTLEPGQRYWILDVPFDQRGIPGVQWYRQINANLWVGPTLPEHLRPYRSRPHTLERFRENQLNQTLSTDDDPVEPMTPRPIQIDGARAIARHAASGGPQFFLTDDTGTGKTLSAIIGAKAVAKLRGITSVLVIADRPAEITIGHWARSIAAVGDGGLTWVVTTWDRLAKVAGLVEWGIVIADEAHMARNQDTKRWGHYARILGLHRARSKPYVIAMTATPSHTPLEQGYLIPAYAHALGGSTKQWAADWPGHLSAAGVHISRGRYGPQWSDDPAEQAADLKRVRGWLADQDPPAMLHRPAPWGPAPIDALPIQLTAEQQAAYASEWETFRAENELARRGKNSAQGRAALMRYRQKAGMIRVDTTVEWAQAQIEAGRQVVISCEFVDTAADPIAERLSEHGVSVARLYGSGRFDAEAERLRFQTGQAQVAVMTLTASISLHAGEQLGDGTRATATPRVGLFHQTRYSGIQGRQIVGRTHRDHQYSPWKIAVAEGTVEEKIARTMIRRYATTTESAGGDASALTDLAAMLGVGWLGAGALTAD